jgi:hypothetical protein
MWVDLHEGILEEFVEAGRVHKDWRGEVEIRIQEAANPARKAGHDKNYQLNKAIKDPAFKAQERARKKEARKKMRANPAWVAREKARDKARGSGRQRAKAKAA